MCVICTWEMQQRYAKVRYSDSRIESTSQPGFIPLPPADGPCCGFRLKIRGKIVKQHPRWDTLGSMRTLLRSISPALVDIE
jgi:hypothetical protein